MFDSSTRTAFIVHLLAVFTWVLTLGSAVVFVIGCFVAGWSWSLLWISGGLFVLTVTMSIFAFSKFFGAMERF